MKTVFKKGDRVAFSVKFLKNTLQTTGEKPRMRGSVKSVETMPSGNQYCIVLWDAKGESSVLGDNLTLISRIGIDAALNT